MDTYIKNTKWKQIPEMSTPVFTPQMSFVKESRVIKHWDKMGVIPFKLTKENKRTKYTLSDLIWINVVFEMREFGIPLQRIKDAFDIVVGKYEQWEILIHQIIYEENIPYDIIITPTEIYQLIYSVPYVWCTDEFKPYNGYPHIPANVPDTYFILNVNSIVEKTIKNHELPLMNKIYVTYLNKKLYHVG